MANIFVRLKDKGNAVRNEAEGLHISGNQVIEVEQTETIDNHIKNGLLIITNVPATEVPPVPSFKPIQKSPRPKPAQNVTPKQQANEEGK